MTETITRDKPREAVVYRLYDDAGTLLYIGSAYDTRTRFRAHQEKPWWAEVARHTEERYSTRTYAYQAEYEAIRAERPKYNKFAQEGYRPDSPAVRAARELARERRKAMREAEKLRRRAEDAGRRSGLSWVEARAAGAGAYADALEETGLFRPEHIEAFRRGKTW